MKNSRVVSTQGGISNNSSSGNQTVIQAGPVVAAPLAKKTIYGQPFQRNVNVPDPLFKLIKFLQWALSKEQLTNGWFGDESWKPFIKDIKKLEKHLAASGTKLL